MEKENNFFENEMPGFENNQNDYRNEIFYNENTDSLLTIKQEILFITTYPPRQCGIATYSQDLIAALENKFEGSFKIGICALETGTEKHQYPEKIEYILNTDQASDFIDLAEQINQNDAITMVLVQHEFGLYSKNPLAFQYFLESLNKPIIMVFHTVLPNPDPAFQLQVQQLARFSESIIVMTQSSAKILIKDYAINGEKISVIPHGTHLVEHQNKTILKEKYGVAGKKLLATFGLLGAGKSIETTLKALPSIIIKNPEVIFLILGKTHPSILKTDGERYRDALKEIVYELNLQNHVRFINQFLKLPELLEYLQLTDIYLFTSKDPNQAVSGTFAYAMSCGCPIISTPIPHALELLKNNVGILVQFENPNQISKAVNKLLKDENLRNNMSINAQHLMAPTAWENTALAHSKIFEKISKNNIQIDYKLPKLNWKHIHKMTDEMGIFQFAVINEPDIDSGYTLDDNARALVVTCQAYEIQPNEGDLVLIRTYLAFIKYCQQPDGRFLNYVNEQKQFTDQNFETNLEDSNGRAIWALGYLISLQKVLPVPFVIEANTILEFSLMHLQTIHSTRAMAFIIKGLYFKNLTDPSLEVTALIRQFADKIVQMFKHEASQNWTWYESYLTYANSIIPEAILCAYIATKNLEYKLIAKASFDFLINKIFSNGKISVISNKNWLQKGTEKNMDELGGEQAIDVAYTILALEKFYNVFGKKSYLTNLKTAFSWFLGNNHLDQIIYNPCTGGCYDGLEDSYVNLNQGAESTLSYMMARLTLQKLLLAKPENLEITHGELVA